MKRETIFAVFLGVFLAGVVSVFIINKSKEMTVGNVTSQPAPTLLVKPKNQKQSLDQVFLEISEPRDGLVTGKEVIEVIGKSNKNSLIVIHTPKKEIIYKNERESFRINLSLVPGENPIKIVSYPRSRSLSPKEKSLRIYYLKPEL
ncbi:MAG: hypothetical protein NZL96_00460 [Patescibacteria group bacterium]|nr:hypothetical protein [Patescibacteria group bacterium]